MRESEKLPDDPRRTCANIPNYCSVIRIYRAGRNRETKSVEQANTMILLKYCRGRKKKDGEGLMKVKERGREENTRRGEQINSPLAL